MGRVETIEYYDRCPSCGAAADGDGICDYCGASLVRRRTTTETNESFEDMALREDRGLPVEKAKVAGMSGSMKFFLLLFGGIWFLTPTVLVVLFSLTGIMKPWLFAFFGIFWAVGLGCMVPLVVSVVRQRACRNGQQVTASLRGYEDGIYMINERPVQVMRLRVETEAGPKLVLLNTGATNRRYAPGMELHLRTANGRYIIQE
ncbi:MAG: hypothetical protein Q4E12_06805 [Coriobacteriia bacterium]|nr:hypothetical protein [Coriobacteriia bacterium]